MSKKIEKFREPLALYPTGLSAKSQDMLALVLRELSKISGHNRKEAKKAERDENYSPKILPIPESYFFSEEEIMQVFDCSIKDIVRTLGPAADHLMSQIINFWAGDDTRLRKRHLVRSADYVRGGKLEIVLEKIVAEVMYEEIGERFSEMDLRLFVSLSGKYERRLLKLLSKWRGMAQGAPKIAFSDYRREIGVGEDTHTRPDAFRKYCIIQPIEDIIKKSDGMWTPTDKDGKGYELFKTGRKFTHVRICLEWRPNEVEVIVKEDEERKKIITELEQTEQIILAMPIVPELISKPYMDKAKEIGHNIPFEVKQKIKAQGEDNCEDIPY